MVLNNAVHILRIQFWIKLIYRFLKTIFRFDELDRSYFLTLSNPLLSETSLMPISDIVKVQKKQVLILRLQGQVYIFASWALKEGSTVSLVDKIRVGILYHDREHLVLSKCNRRCRRLFLRYCSKRRSEFISVANMKAWPWTEFRLCDLIQDEMSNFTSAFYRWTV